MALEGRDQEQDIWIWNLAREIPTRLTFDPRMDRSPVWTPDSRRVVFRSGPGGLGDLLSKAADGTGSVDRLTEGRDHYFSFSPDAGSLVFSDWRDDTRHDLHVLSLAGDRGIETVVATEFNEWNAELSPDGRWIAYESDQSGRYEVYVRPFPDVDAGQWQISMSGGTHPLWGFDGHELFYRSGLAVMSVGIQADPSFTLATPEVLFEGNCFRTSEGRSYDVTQDGQRFLMIKEAEGPDNTSTPTFIFVQNWHEDLKRLLPTN